MIPKTLTYNRHYSIALGLYPGEIAWIPQEAFQIYNPSQMQILPPSSLILSSGEFAWIPPDAFPIYNPCEMQILLHSSP